MFHRPPVPLTLHLPIRSTTLSQYVWYGRWPLPYPLPIRYPNHHHHPHNMHHYDYLTCARTVSIDSALSSSPATALHMSCHRGLSAAQTLKHFQSQIQSHNLALHHIIRHGHRNLQDQEQDDTNPVRQGAVSQFCFSWPGRCWSWWLAARSPGLTCDGLTRGGDGVGHFYTLTLIRHSAAYGIGESGDQIGPSLRYGGFPWLGAASFYDFPLPHSLVFCDSAARNRDSNLMTLPLGLCAACVRGSSLFPLHRSFHFHPPGLASFSRPHTQGVHSTSISTCLGHHAVNLLL